MERKYSNNLRCLLTRKKLAYLFVPQQNSLAMMELYTCSTWTKRVRTMHLENISISVQERGVINVTSIQLSE